jgi:microcystin-dependent protein
MADPYIGEIRIFAGSFAPAGWELCDGKLLAIAEYDALYTLIGTTYGGDGQETFALPNLCGRVAVHQGQGPSGNTYVLGEMAGVETVTLTPNQIPQHTHVAIASAAGTVDSPAGATFASSSVKQFAIAPSAAAMAAPLTVAGGSQPHDNMLPFLAVSFIISLFGVFPSPT